MEKQKLLYQKLEKNTFADKYENRFRMEIHFISYLLFLSQMFIIIFNRDNFQMIYDIQVYSENLMKNKKHTIDQMSAYYLVYTGVWRLKEHIITITYKNKLYIHQQKMREINEYLSKLSSVCLFNLNILTFKW